MPRVPSRQVVLIASTLAASWWGMQQVHEAGHVLAAWWSGGRVANVVLHPLQISRTDLEHNPRPLLVAWAGPVLGVLLPLAAYLVAAWRRVPEAFLLRFFAGFCLIANGAYLAGGALIEAGDAGELLRHGASRWLLWAFGLVCVPAGLYLWHGLGRHFGLGPTSPDVSARATWVSCAALLVALIVGLLSVYGAA